VPAAAFFGKLHFYRLIEDSAIVSKPIIADKPLVWVLSGFKAGDTTQMLALADELGWEYEVKQFVYRRTELLTNRLLGPTLAGIDLIKSSKMESPWPDLVITAGRRNEPVARWIKKQSPGTRLVNLGRPWSAVHCFDLVITTPQYFVPSAENVLQIALPLHPVTEEKLSKWRQQWYSKFTDMPEPRWAVMLGGSSGPFVFNPEKAARLASWLNQSIQQTGGSVLVTNSPRTSSISYQAFLNALRVPCLPYHWTSSDPDNPYQGYLACADNLVITGESMSMLAEAAATHTPLYIYDLSDCPESLNIKCKPWWRYRHNFRYRPLVHRLAKYLAPQRMKRDVTRIQKQLVSTGRAAWVGQAGGNPVLTNDSDMQIVVKRVGLLME
jgi:mitochondrial fission protein ELM1